MPRNCFLSCLLHSTEIVFAVIFQNLKTELESRCSDEVVENQESENLLEQLISRIFQVVNRLTG